MRDVVTVPLHAAAVEQVGAAHVHGDADHAMRGHAAAGGGDHCGDVASTGLRVKVGAPAALAVQLGVGVV